MGVVLTACTAILDVDRLRGDARAIDGAASDADGGVSPDGGDAAGATVTRGLVGHWTFDENDGDVAVDTSPAKNDGLLRAGTGAKPARTAGKRGGALSFSGGAYVETKALLLSTQFTLAFWTNAPSVATMDQPRLFSSDTNWLVKLNGRGMQLSVGNGYAMADYSLPDGEWHHYAVVFDGRAKWYVDGAAVAAGTTTFSGSDRVLPGTGSFRMAVATNLGFPFTGLLDDVRVHDVALTDAEVRAIFEGR